MSVPRSGVITLSRDGINLVLPVNAPSVPINRTRDYRDVDIVNFRTVGRYGNRKLEEINVDSFFPARYASYCNYGPTGLLTPAQYVGIIGAWQMEGTPKPVYVSITGQVVETWFAIVDFNTDDRAGEPGDIYYHLHLKEFVYSTATVFGFGPPPRPPSPAAPQGGEFYTIVSGDCLWNIAKRYYGDGSRWPVIWDANKPMRSGNPNLIFPGEVIFVPAV